MAHSAAHHVSPAGHISIPPARVRAGLALACVLALATGFLVGHNTGPDHALATDPDLVRVLRFMAAVKGLMAAAAWWAADWRLRQPARARTAFAAVVACALMAVGPGLIWGMQHVLFGGLSTYAGLALLLAVGWADRANVRARLVDLVQARQRRSTGTATSLRRSGGNVQGGS